MMESGAESIRERAEPARRQIGCAGLVVLCAFITFYAYRSLAQSSPTSSFNALTLQEQRGKAIYRRGVNSSGREIVALMGEIEVPAPRLTCAGCHGAQGEGKTEGGVTAGQLTWAHLTKPYGHIHPSGRKHGPFNELSFTRAVMNGTDPAGNPLLVPMPRYRMTQDEMADLIAYIKRLSADSDPGVTEQKIIIGSVIPNSGPLAETGAAMRDVLTAYFNEINNGGGIYNRKIELRVVDSRTDAGATAAAAVEEFATREQVFAFVGGLSAGADKELAALAARREIPFIGPGTLQPVAGIPVNRQVFYLQPGVMEQARALINFAASRQGLTKMRAAVVAYESELTLAASAACEEKAKKIGWANIDRYVYRVGDFNASQLVRKLGSSGTGVVFFFGHSGDEAAFIKEATAAKWTPHIFLLGALVGRDLLSASSQEFTDKLFLAFPTVPGDITLSGMSELRALHEKYKIAPRHIASQLAAFAAAKVFIEALKRAGQGVTREKLIAALENLYEFETGVAPRLTFGPNQRVGATGAYIISIDAGKKQLVPMGGWVSANQ
jgi:ABC-type branched-subunit amino acid transport system substrate-binding protein